LREIKINLLKKIQFSSFTKIVGAYAASNMLSSVLNMLGGLISARLLGPTLFGLFNSINLLQGYIGMTQLGVINGLNRELPFYFGRNKIQSAQLMGAVANLWSRWLGILSFVGLLIPGIYLLLTNESLKGITFIVIGINLYAYFNAELYLKVTFRTGSDFKKLSLITIYKSIISFVSLALVYVFGYFGFLGRALIVAYSEFGLLFKFRPLKIKPIWSKPHFIHLFKVGFPIFVVGNLDSLWFTLNSTFIVEFLGGESLGLYTISNLAFATLSLIPSSLNQVLYPKLAREFGEGAVLSKLLKSALKAGFTVFAILVPFTIIAWYFLPYFVELLLPKFMGGVEAGRYTLMLPLVMSLASIDNIFIVCKKQKKYLISLIIGIVVYVSIILFFKFYGELTLAMFAFSFIAGKVASLTTSFITLNYLSRKEKI